MRTPMLSILIPAHQAANSIVQAIRSIGQRKDTEVIVAPDDGSCAYKSLELQFPGWVHVLPPTLQAGPGASRNRAFDASRGHYITMLDADDVLTPGALDQGLLLARTSAERIAFFRTRYTDCCSLKVVREFPAQPMLTARSFIDFNGSIHAIYARSHWHPYMENLFSEDVLHDGMLLKKAGYQAPLTRACYQLNLHAQSVCATIQQEKIIADYHYIHAHSHCHWIRAIYAQKIRQQRLFMESCPPIAPHSFHAMALAQEPSA